MTQWRNPRGVALVITLLAVSFFSALALGLVLTASTQRLAAANHHQSVALLNAAEAALALAVRELEPISDWSSVIGGPRRSSFIDAPSPGVRMLPGGVSLDLIAMTNELTCGRPTPCTDAQVRASTLARPWGVNNPRWQPFVYTRLDAIIPVAHLDAVYVVVWIGDDPGETDGDPLVDGGGGAAAGLDVVWVRVAALGTAGSRRAIKAHFSRVCHGVSGARTCLPGIHVQSWRVVNATLP